LHWSARVVSAEEFHTAKLQALEVQREKKKFQTQRLTLKRVCVRNAAAFSGVIHSTSVVHDHAEEEDMHIREMEDEISRLQNEADELRAEVEALQAELEEVDTNRVNAEDSRDQVSGSWRFTASQLESAQQELKALRKEVDNHANYKRDAKAEIEILKQEITQYKNEVNRLNNELSVVNETLKMSEDSESMVNTEAIKALEDADAKIQELERQLIADKEEIFEKCMMEFQVEKEQLDKEWEEALNVLKADKDVIHHTNLKLQTQLDETMVLHKAEIDRLQDECCSYKNNIVGLTAELTVFRTSNERLKTQVTELEQLVAQYISEKASKFVQGEENDSNASNIDVYDSDPKSPATATTIEEDVSALIHQLEAEKRNTEAWEEECGNLRVQNEALAVELMQQKEHMHLFSLQNEQSRHHETHESIRLNDVVKQLTAQIEQLSSDKAFAEMSLESCVQERNVVIKMLEAQLLSCQNELADVRGERATALETQCAAVNELAEYRSETSQRIADLENLLVEADDKHNELMKDLLAQQQDHDNVMKNAHELKTAEIKAMLLQAENEKRDLQLLLDTVNKDEVSAQSTKLQEEFDFKLQCQRMEFEAEKAHLLEQIALSQGLGEKNEELAKTWREEERRHLEAEFAVVREKLLADVNHQVETQLAIRVGCERTHMQQKMEEEKHHWLEQELMKRQAQIMDGRSNINGELSISNDSYVSSVFSPLPTNTPHRVTGMPAMMDHDQVSPTPSGATTTSATMTPGVASMNSNCNTTEAIRLTALLRAKEDQLKLTMRLYDEQSSQLADVTAEVSELRTKAHALSAEEAEKLFKLQSALSEISASIAFWSN
jgi:peptidoglycan hydrolase CwlO-like protein